MIYIIPEGVMLSQSRLPMCSAVCLCLLSRLYTTKEERGDYCKGRSEDSREVRHVGIFIFEYISSTILLFLPCQIQAFMVDVVSNHSEVTQLVKIGNSYEGRDFYAVHVRMVLIQCTEKSHVWSITEQNVLFDCPSRKF